MQKKKGSLYFLEKKSARFCFFRDFLITYEEKKMECSSEFFSYIFIDLEKSSQLLGTSLSWLSYVFFQFILRNTGKMSCDKALKAMWKGN